MRQQSRSNFVKTASTGVFETTFPLSAKKICFPENLQKMNLNEVREILGAQMDNILDKGGPYSSYRMGIKQRPDL